MSAGTGDIAGNLASIRARIVAACERAGRDPAGVTLVGVSKTQPAAAVLGAIEAGLEDFGENYVQEALAKMAAVRALLPAGTRMPPFHFIGHLQANKAKAATGPFAILHGIDSARLVRAIDSAAEAPIEVLIQVNVAGEATKHGVPPGDLPALLHEAQGARHVRVSGLMTIAPEDADPQASRPWFRALRSLGIAHSLPALSMGMTGDFEVAIEEGATHVRVGRAIFGERRL